MTRNQELAWAAGIIEGEGWFANGQQRNRKGKLINSYLYAVAVGMHKRDVDVLRRLKRIFGLGELYGPYKDGKLVQWKVGGIDAVCSVCIDVYPFLGKRRQRRIREMFPRFRYRKAHA